MTSSDGARGRSFASAASAALATIALLVGCSRDPVDKTLVGTWQTAIASPAGAWQLRFTTLSNGQYRTDFQGPALLPSETGFFRAGSGKWRLEKLTGSVDEGTYEFVADDTVLFKSKTGAVLWNRIANDTAAATTALAAAAPAAIASPSAVAPVPSAELLAAGPFGSALADSSATPSAAAPFGAAPSAAAGAASTAAENPSTGLPFALPQQAIIAVNGAATAQPAAAADGTDQATQKVGQRIQTFGSNAKNKVRNFFTRNRHKNDDGADPKQDH